MTSPPLLKTIKNQRLIDIRMSSLKQTYEFLINQIENIINTQTDRRILRMKESQRENMMAKREKQFMELNSKRTISIEFEEIAGGFLAIDN